MQNIMMHLRCNELNELAGAVSKRKFYDDYEFNELYELAGAVRNRLRFQFFASEATGGRAREIRKNKYQCAAKIRKIRKIRSFKKTMRSPNYCEHS